MTDDPLHRYAAMLRDTTAPDTLPDQVLAKVRSQQSAPAQPAGPQSHRAANPTPPTPQANRPAVSTFAIKRHRFRGAAIAACLVIVAGIGATAFALNFAGNFATNNSAPATTSGNFFQMVAFADEANEPQRSPVVLSSEDFFPVRTSVGPRYDLDTDSYPGDIEASRSYNVNLTCVGSNVASLTYQLKGGDASFNNWQLTEAAHEAEPELGAALTTGDQSNAFTVSYDGQDMSSVDSVHHEIYLNYTLNDELTAVWDEFYAEKSQVNRPQGTIPEDELARLAEAHNKLELALAQYDTTVISQTKLVLTATFTDGATATKTYRLAPTDNFEQAYSTYLAAQQSSDGTTAPSFPSLYTLEEIM